MSDPLDRQLQDLVRDIGPAIVLAGPEDARRRGERRRARRRAGAAGASVATVTIVLAGTFFLAPWPADGSTRPAPPAATGRPAGTSVPSPSATPEPRLAATALPAQDQLRWRSAEPGPEAEERIAAWSATCGWDTAAVEAGETTGGVQYFLGRNGAVASWEVLDHARAQDAAATEQALLSSADCSTWPWPQDSESITRALNGAESATLSVSGVGMRVETGFDHIGGRVYLARAGDRLAVLRVFAGPPGATWPADPESADTADRAEGTGSTESTEEPEHEAEGPAIGSAAPDQDSDSTADCVVDLLTTPERSEPDQSCAQHPEPAR